MLGAARIAGIMAAKRTHELIPLCHPLRDLQGRGRPRRRTARCPASCVRATVKVTGQTGVEMEALTAVSVACLTIYDMVKAVERGMRIEGIRLVEKRGGKSGHYRARRSRAVAAAAGRRRARPRARRTPRRCRPKPCRSREAHGRVLAADLAALRTQPPVAVSAMDGYAVRAADVATRAGASSR